ncbi:glycosyltransferase [Flavobacterium glaciei]|uniref:Glycosyltransferase involved in cell wall biosynthesis n=1 Tax=Flavobacterium glaciei TaxID=386300 RepID=A0A562Q5X2_9FLAO|nr:glycosyltransferase [Flavobacterium glaciei]RDI58347.1 glycosyltransferase involved in cell wall biosynthesis [Flavobacterium glaciei]TWI52132.1 glycosyltransferase involved in cell wall biosynthesis [Flavobacterium glaciei]
MVKRKRIGLIFSYNENWIAGSYYILNIIHALNILNDKEKPVLVILSDSVANFDLVKKETNYPFLEYFVFPLPEINYNLFENILNKFSRKIIKRPLLVKKPKQPVIDFLYPNSVDAIQVSDLKKVNWIPDFQEEHLPQYFSEEEIKSRKHIQREIYCYGDIVVLSSKDAAMDFKRLYPSAKAKTFVLNFAVTHPDFSHINPNLLVEKYNISYPYFFLPNQFWAHKNHMIVLKALKVLQDEGISILVVFSGNENDYRNNDYVGNLKSFIEVHNLKNNVKFLGFIPRDEQLFLMKQAEAIIQPSFFEGWSTVVEDVKALNKFILLSDIKVHREQILNNCEFFKPNDADELALLIKKHIKVDTKINYIDYSINVKKFSHDFIELINSATI